MLRQRLILFVILTILLLVVLACQYEVISISPPFQFLNRGHYGKPKLILHIGPPKMGTTSLQTDLTAMMDQLLLDNYVYAGRYYQPYVKERNHKLILNRTYSVLLDNARDMFPNCDDPISKECGSGFKAELDRYKLLNRNVIISDEPLLHFWNTKERFEIVREILNDEWEVLVVIGHRRFFAWLPSQWFQYYRLDHVHKLENINWPTSRGRAIQPLFPNTLIHWRQFAYTDFAIKIVSESFDYSILNLHNKSSQYSSTRSQFLCEIIRDARHACRESLVRDRHHETTEMNKRKSSDTDALFYDAMAMFAAQKNLIDTETNTRRQVAASFQLYNERELNQTAHELPLVCPSTRQLQGFLTLSLKLERAVFPNNTSPDSIDDHEAEFRQTCAGTHLRDNYCWIDTNAVFALPEWKRFLANNYHRSS